MCDTLIKQNIPVEDHPQYVYKRVQKIGKDEYVSPVMGEPMKRGKWKKAPTRRNQDLFYGDMIDYIRRRIRKDRWAHSSRYTDHHNGRWAAFKDLEDAKYVDLVSNFVDKSDNAYPAIVVKCEIKGIVDQARYSSMNTYLASHIRIVCECK